MDFLLNNKTLLFNAVFILLPIVNVLLGAVGYDNFTPTDDVVQLGLALVAFVNAVSKMVVDKQKK